MPCPLSSEWLTTPPQSQGFPVLGQTAPLVGVGTTGASMPLALCAASASSVYAPGSTLAKARKASRMGRYPVQRL